MIFLRISVEIVFSEDFFWLFLLRIFVPRSNYDLPVLQVLSWILSGSGHGVQP